MSTSARVVYTHKDIILLKRGHQTWWNMETHEDNKCNVCVTGPTNQLGLDTGQVETRSKV